MRNSKRKELCAALLALGLTLTPGLGRAQSGSPASSFSAPISTPVTAAAATPSVGVGPSSSVPSSAPQPGQAAGQAGDPGALAVDNTPPSIRVGAGDLINILVFETPELSASVRVNQNGEANLPVLGPVQLAGMSANDAARTIEQALKSRGLLLDPHVTVFVSEYASQGASVLGEVKAPGVYPTLGSRRMLDMISLAGGTSQTAGKVVSIIHQGDPSHPTQIPLQPNPATMHAQINPIIQPGDTLVVAKSGVVYVIGDVLRPGGILVDNNERLSVIEALSLAGGMNKTAALSKTKIVRKLPTGREEVDLDLKHILYGKQADVLVSDGDILFVPTSLGKTFLYRGIEAIIALSTSYVIFSRNN